MMTSFIRGLHGKNDRLGVSAAWPASWPRLRALRRRCLTDTSHDQAQRLLDLLVRAHLIQHTSPDRYGMHDLLRAYATHLATREDADDERRVALTRLFDHYLATAAASMDILQPVGQHRRPRVSLPGTPAPPLPDLAAARTWLDAERVTLSAACAHTAAHGWPSHTIRLSSTLFCYLEVGGRYPDALSIHTHALHAARQTGDQSAEAQALNSLGLVYEKRGRYPQAVEYHQQALTLFGSIGDQAGEALAWDSLGIVYRQQGRYEQADDYLQPALALFREIGYRYCEATALNSLGETHHAVGRFDDARIQHTAALTLATETDHRYEQARAHNGLAHTHHATGDRDRARQHWREALSLYTDLGIPEADDVRAHLAALDHTVDDED